MFLFYNRQGKKVKRKCKYCGKEFECGEKSKQKYCNPLCRIKNNGEK